MMWCAYSHHAGGDITGIHDLLHPTWSASFGYNDHTGRLISGLGSWGLETYDYDFAGNRISKSVDGQPTISCSPPTCSHP